MFDLTVYLSQIIFTRHEKNMDYGAIQHNSDHLSFTSVIPAYTDEILYNFFGTFDDSSKELLSE